MYYKYNIVTKAAAVKMSKSIKKNNPPLNFEAVHITNNVFTDTLDVHNLPSRLTALDLTCDNSSEIVNQSMTILQLFVR
jgi:hypothetical protein